MPLTKQSSVSLLAQMSSDTSRALSVLRHRRHLSHTITLDPLAFCCVIPRLLASLVSFPPVLGAHPQVDSRSKGAWELNEH